MGRKTIIIVSEVLLVIRLFSPVYAQQPNKAPHIGILSGGSPLPISPRFVEFREALHK